MSKRRVFKGYLFVGVLAIVSCTTQRDQETFEEILATVMQSGYKFDDADVSCGGYPTLPVGTMQGVCLGAVHISNVKSFAPRVIMEIPGRKNDFLVTDYANWSQTAGKIWRLSSAGNKKSVFLKQALGGLSLPHQILAGPENSIYFGEDHSIKAFKISDIPGDGSPINPKNVRTVLTGLPRMDVNGIRISMHPLKHFIFDKENNLYLNIGAYTDACSEFKGKDCILGAKNENNGIARDIKNQGALIRKYKYKGKGVWDTNYTIVAQGLRNSMGLFFAANGDLLQVENSRDFAEGNRPFEELNRISKEDLEASSPSHHGWPYCYDATGTSDEWADFSFKCNSKNPKYRPPLLLLPPHGAPLGMIHYTGNLLASLKNKLIVGLHGYRPTGHRILAFDLASSGIPQVRTSAKYLEDLPNGTFAERSYPAGAGQAQAVEVIGKWNESAGRRAKGAPVALTQAQDGSIWIADDKNHAIYRLASTNKNATDDTPALDQAKIYSEILGDIPSYESAYLDVRSTVFQSKQCSGCHDDFTSEGDDKNDKLSALKYAMAMGTWIRPNDPESSILHMKLSPPGKSDMPPIDRSFDSPSQPTEFLNKVTSLIKNTPSIESIIKVTKSASLQGTAPGVPPVECGDVPVGSFLVAVSKQKQTLGGISVIQVAHHNQGRFAKSGACNASEKFWIPAQSISFVLP